MYTVYKHTTPSGKIYIGITSQSVEERWRKGEGYKSQVFYKAIKKYGWNNIKHEVLFKKLTKEEAEQKEIELIAFYKSNQKDFGYNIENGGNVTGTHSEETKRKIGMRHKGRIFSEETKRKMRENHADVSGKNNPHYGKHYSPEVRKRMSEARKGKQLGTENPMYGKTHSEDVRKIQSEHRKGKCVGALNHKSKSVIQFSISGEFIKKYECISDAERALNIPQGGGGHISSCAKGKSKSAYGYIWKYSEGGTANEAV